MYDWSWLKKRKLFILTTALLISFCLCINSIMFYRQSCRLIGIYVVYEGGYIAPEVLQFLPSGQGNAYAVKIDDEPWLENMSLQFQYLQSPIPFHWRIQRITAVDVALQIVYQSGICKSYVYQYEEDIGGIGARGISLLSQDLPGSCGYLKINIIR